MGFNSLPLCVHDWKNNCGQYWRNWTYVCYHSNEHNSIEKCHIQITNEGLGIFVFVVCIHALLSLELLLILTNSKVGSLFF